MPADDGPSRSVRALRTARFEAFSDGVFAIAITLLVLDLALPMGLGEMPSGGDVLRALGSQWPTYLAYVVSFASVGAMWVQHSVITEHLDHVDGGLVRLNLLLLLVVSFLPFPTKLLAEYIHDDSAERVAVTGYGLTLLAASTMIGVLWRYSVREHLVRTGSTDEDLQALTKKLTPTLAAYAVVIAVGIALPLVAVFGYLATALFMLAPRGVFRRRPV
jgi:uncharacterized membrane protein